MRKLARWLAGHDSVAAAMTNERIGEVFVLSPEERAEVTCVAADEMQGKLPVISAVSCKGIKEAALHARVKLAMFMAGCIDSPVVREPIMAPAEGEQKAIKRALASAELLARA